MSDFRDSAGQVAEAPSRYDLDELERLFRDAPAAVAWLEGPRHLYRLANDAYQRLVGERDLVGRTVAEALPEIAAQGFVATLDSVYASGQPFVGNEVRLQLRRLADGALEPRTVDFVFQPVRDADARITGIFIQATDVTQRVAAQVALAESESKFRAITNSIDQMIWSTQADGFHDYFNDRWYEFTGVPYGSTDGQGWNDMFHPDDQKRAWAVWRHSLNTGEPYHIEYRLRHRSGAYRWVLGRAQAVRDGDGRIVRWFGTCTDIQDIVDAREVLSRSREELERQIEHRTQQLLHAEEQLRQAHKMEAIGQLTGGIAHDFNNMLQGIVGALDVIRKLEQTGRSANIPRFVDMAMSSAQRAAAMTHRLLAFARQQPLAPQRVDLVALVQSLRDLVRRTAGESITLQLDLAGDTWPTRCDPNQLESALLNLAINARDAMPGGGQITLSTRNVQLPATQLGPNEVLAAGDFVEVGVHDTGTGMPQSVIARAFDPFFTTKPIGQGTGLGLSMVYGFARQSGGFARIESREGEGTCVALLLPRDSGEQAVGPVVEPAPELVGGRGEVIVVVEDDEVVRMLAVETLTGLGYRVHAAATGPEGAQLLNELGAVDLLLSDIGLPGGVSGKQLADAARASRPALKVILITGYAQEVTDTDLLAQKIELLRKPVLIDVLLRKVQDVLKS
ncbi:PAS domain S-box protein [Ramlibacter sp. USB13]|uniref:histidine kinase n=1 Tax=Ramlibacter cellulosilyticus TaxID=2764187 RepID=A0A923MPT2_9BURK|nr:hybrid sensor histidine kinase/response regulator [Ramlibacter cellulosilyticus]MBC5783260.1 PAS domain S-box protein [Ramlibacter cellulosilyticus]